MMRKIKRACRRFWRRTQGVAAVEFAIMALVLIFLIAGIADFGHAWYLQQTITNASQEGVRYATNFNCNNSLNNMTCPAPGSLNPTIDTYVKSTVLAGTGLTVNVNATGPGMDGVAGHPVTVTVTTNKNWFFLGLFMPSGVLPNTLSASTVMNNQGTSS